MSLFTSCLFAFLIQDPGAIAEQCTRFHAGGDAVKKAALQSISELGARDEPQSVEVAEALALGLKHGSDEVHELAVQLLTTRPNPEVARRELLLAAREAESVLKKMADLQADVMNNPPLPDFTKVSQKVWMKAMDELQAKTKALHSYLKTHEGFGGYHTALVRSLAAFPGEETVDVLSQHLVAMPSSSANSAILMVLSEFGTRTAADAMIRHLVEVEKLMKVTDKAWKRAMREKPGRKVPKGYSKERWIENQRASIARRQESARKRVEHWQQRSTEANEALLKLAKVKGLKKPTALGASRWRAWVKKHRDALAEKA